MTLFPIALVCLFVSAFGGLLSLAVVLRYAMLYVGPDNWTLFPFFFGFWAISFFVFGRLSRTRGQPLWTVFALSQAMLGIWVSVLSPIFTSGWLAKTPALTFLLMLPLAFLWGAGVPLLTQIIGSSVEDPRRTQSQIYGWFLLGSGLGLGVAELFLIPSFGLWASLLVASILHLAVVATVYFYIRPRFPLTLLPPTTMGPLRPDQKLLLGISFLQGVFLLGFAQVIVRFGQLAIGPMVDGFSIIPILLLLGMGFGSIFENRKFSTPQSLALTLFASLLAFIAVYLTLSYWPYWNYLLRSRYAEKEMSLWYFEFVLCGAYFLLLGTPSFFLGRALPLCFSSFKSEGSVLGYRAGQLFAANASGGMLGILIVHFSLYGSIGLGGLAKAFLVIFAAAHGLSLCISFQGKERNLALASCLVLIFTITIAPRFLDAHFLTPFSLVSTTPMSNLGRDAFTAILNEGAEPVIYMDYPDASVAISKIVENGREVARTLFVNGQSDGDTRSGLFSSLLLGHLPQLLSLHAGKTAVIGWGNGVTVEAVAAHDTATDIHVIEASPAVAQQREAFDFYNNKVSQDSKVKIHQSALIPFFAQNITPYEVIIVGPKEPSLKESELFYTQEFYKVIGSNLSVDGVFVQWVPTQFFTEELLATTIKTMAKTFPEIRAFQIRQGGLALLASKLPIGNSHLKLARQRLAEEKVRDSLLRADIGELETLLAAEILSPSITKLIAAKANRLQRLDKSELNEKSAKALFDNAQTDVFQLREKVAGGTVNRDNLFRLVTQGERLKLDLWKELKRVYCLSPFSGNPRLCEETYLLGLLLSPNEVWDEENQKRFAHLMSEPILRLKSDPTGRFTREKKKELDDSLRFIRWFQAPLAQFPSEETLRWFAACIKNTDVKDPLRGECLFHRVIFLEERGVPKEKLRPLATDFLKWFDRLPANTENYSTFVAAKVTMDRWLQ